MCCDRCDSKKSNIFDYARVRARARMADYNFFAVNRSLDSEQISLDC